jgi:hypothetical protein
VVERDVMTEVERRVDCLAPFGSAERLACLALRPRADTFDATFLALPQLVDAAVVEQSDREREREDERRGVQPPPPDVRPRRLDAAVPVPAVRADEDELQRAPHLDVDGAPAHQRPR